MTQVQTYRNFNFTIVNLGKQISGMLTINRASDRETSSQDFLYSSFKLLGQRLEAHSTSNFQDIFERNITVMLNFEDEAGTGIKTYCSFLSYDLGVVLSRHG